MAAGIAAADGLLVSRRVSTGICASTPPCPAKTLLPGSPKASSTLLLLLSGPSREAGPSCTPWRCWSQGRDLLGAEGGRRDEG